MTWRGWHSYPVGVVSVGERESNVTAEDEWVEIREEMRGRESSD